MSTRQLKSRDLGRERSRCGDTECPQWKSNCARAEKWEGRGEFNWLPASIRRGNAKQCARRIDPVTMKDDSSKPAEGIVDV